MAVNDDERDFCRFLAAVATPVWIAAGLSDWYWHRRSCIARTSGTIEAACHLAMAAEGGAQILLGMFAELSPASVAASALLALVHEATVLADVAYTRPRRAIPPGEEHAHAFMETLPFAIATKAAWHLRGARDRRGLRFRRPPLSAAALAAVLAGSALLGVGSFVEEFARTRGPGSAADEPEDRPRTA